MIERYFRRYFQSGSRVSIDRLTKWSVDTPSLTVWLDVAHVSHLEAVNSREARIFNHLELVGGFRVGKRSANENGGFDHRLLVVKKRDALVKRRTSLLFM